MSWVQTWANICMVYAYILCKCLPLGKRDSCISRKVHCGLSYPAVDLGDELDLRPRHSGLPRYKVRLKLPINLSQVQRKLFSLIVSFLILGYLCYR